MEVGLVWVVLWWGCTEVMGMALLVASLSFILGCLSASQVAYFFGGVRENLRWFLNKKHMSSEFKNGFFDEFVLVAVVLINIGADAMP